MLTPCVFHSNKRFQSFARFSLTASGEQDSRWKSIPQGSPFHTFSIGWHRGILYTWDQQWLPDSWGRRDRGAKGSFRAGLLPSTPPPSFFHSPCFPPCSVTSCSSPQVTSSPPPSHGPLAFEMLILSRVILSLPSHPFFAVNSLQLFLCPAQIFPPVSGLSHAVLSPTWGRQAWGRGGLPHHSLIPFALKFFVFYFLRYDIHAIKRINLKC